jgi:NADPH-dependent curcumin reductase CurA
MNTPLNRRWTLQARPVGLPKRSDFGWATLPVPEPEDGQVLVRTHYISLDPAMRGWMNDARSYVPPIKLNDVMRAGAVGEVVASRSPALKEGECVVGMLGMQDYARARPWWSPPPPVPSVRWSARSPASKAAAPSASPAGRKNAPT